MALWLRLKNCIGGGGGGGALECMDYGKTKDVFFSD